MSEKQAEDCCSTLAPQLDDCGCVISEATTHLPVETNCFQCKAKGTKVSVQTVKAMVVNLERVQPKEYRFCKNPSCKVVYFTEDGSTHLGEADLRERVYQKHPNAENVLICYCFQHTPNSIRLEMANDDTSIVDHITALTKAGRCACDIRNPQGSCCLGNIRQFIKDVN